MGFVLDEPEEDEALVAIFPTRLDIIAQWGLKRARDGPGRKKEESAKGVSSRFWIERKKGARFRLEYGGDESSGKKGVVFRQGYGGGGSPGKKGSVFFWDMEAAARRGRRRKKNNGR
ncbi:unnamed protein product [Linum trigynum]|uniref:Uncharacterized protein n=1 Tax=Linum trigynum TaxID=586398 RepID=A0AAV2G7S4_9ROSI